MQKFLFYFLLAWSSANSAGVTLEQYNIDPNSVTVSGVSAGGAFATQYHVIHSSSVKGAAMFAGLVYHCANGLLATALNCMSTPKLTNVNNLVDTTISLADDGWIDPTSDMIGSKVYIFQGDLDGTVAPVNGDNIFAFYESFGADISTFYAVGAAHCQPTDYYGPACDFEGGDYINNCNYPGSFEALNHMYDSSLIKVDDDTYPTLGDFLEFDQKEFFALNNPSTESIDDIGYIYIPTRCASKENTCKLHLAFHGCQMGREEMEDTYARNSGYLQVAEANNIITVFPQAIHKALSNPNGCWDWWGYTGSIKYVRKDGTQNLAITEMIDRLITGA